MLHKTLVTRTAVAALGAGPAAMARGGGGWGGGGGGGGWGVVLTSAVGAAPPLCIASRWAT